MRRAFLGQKLDNRSTNSATNGGRLIAQCDRVPLPAESAATQRAGGNLAGFNRRSDCPSRQKADPGACGGQFYDRLGERNLDYALRLDSRRL